MDKKEIFKGYKYRFWRKRDKWIVELRFLGLVNGDIYEFWEFL